MRHRKIKGKLSRRTSHRTATIKSLARAVIINERIKTTELKAKTIRSTVEKLITIAKENTVHARRKALAILGDRELVAKLFNDIAPRFADRNGGYTRIIHLHGARRGDNADMAILELVVMKDADHAQEEKAAKSVKAAKVTSDAKAEVKVDEVKDSSSDDSSDADKKGDKKSFLGGLRKFFRTDQ